MCCLVHSNSFLELDSFFTNLGIPKLGEFFANEAIDLSTMLAWDDPEFQLRSLGIPQQGVVFRISHALKKMKMAGVEEGAEEEEAEDEEHTPAKTPELRKNGEQQTAVQAPTPVAQVPLARPLQPPSTSLSSSTTPPSTAPLSSTPISSTNTPAHQARARTTSLLPMQPKSSQPQQSTRAPTRARSNSSVLGTGTKNAENYYF
jgi:hypothetical protein